MIKTSSLKRITHYAGAFLFAGALVGCGDDGGPDPIDAAPDPDTATPIDAGTQDACVGHDCEGIMSPFQLPEGGEFRLERLQLNAAGDEFYLASQAFFFEGQDPPARPTSDPALTLTIRPDIAMLGYRVTDRRPGTLFENGASPEGQMIADTREYYDVGDTVTLTNTEDDSVITLDKQTNATDLSAQIMHDLIYRGPDAADALRNSTYKPEIEGSQAYPLLNLKYGKSALQQPLADDTGVGEVLLYMPSEFTLTSPTEEVYFDADGLVFTKGEDLTITYTFGEAPEGWPGMLVFGAFVNASGQVVASVLKTPTAAGPGDNGTFIVPHEVLELLGEEEAGRFIFGRLMHTAWEYTGDGTRIDMIGIDCKAAPKWVIQEPTGN